MYGIKCYRSSLSVMGQADAWLKRNGVRVEFATLEEAQSEARRINGNTLSRAVNYVPEEI